LAESFKEPGSSFLPQAFWMLWSSMPTCYPTPTPFILRTLSKEQDTHGTNVLIYDYLSLTDEPSTEGICLWSTLVN
jgi:hypothetical protein